MLVDNINYLRKYHPKLREQLKTHSLSESVYIEETKHGQYTINVEHDNKNNYLHSKYDPVKEAKTVIDRYQEEIEKSERVFFYGLGLGYHVEEFQSRYPNHDFSVYEPSKEVFSALINHTEIDNLFNDSLKHLFVEIDQQQTEQFFRSYTSEILGGVSIIVLPSYQRLFSQNFESFVSKFKESIKNSRITNLTSYKFKVRWTLNSLKNFKYVIDTYNFLNESNKESFRSKPCMIVSAGPSLNYEIENLRYIKEYSLAYIFAVGSANNALIENGIIPDAVFTYDPKPYNYTIFSKARENECDYYIPMIFGSSVGYETLEYYRGIKYHVVTSQDYISQFLMGTDSKDYRLIYDSPSIAVITLQILSKLEASPIIFVGQNLGFLDEQYYAGGIRSRDEKKKLIEKEKENSYFVSGTQSEQVLTTDNFNRMRKDLEEYIRYYGNHFSIDFINTTVGGAHIQGTRFESLDDIVRYLSPINKNFFMNNLGPTNRIDIKQVENLNLSKSTMATLLKDYHSTLNEIRLLIDNEDEKGIKLKLNYLDELNKKINEESYYKVIILPMMITENELTNKKLKRAIEISSLFERSREILSILSNHFQTILRLYELVEPVYKKEIEELVN